MPSTTSSSVSAVLASSTVMTPSLPTLSMALAIISPTSVSPLAEMVPTWAISELVGDLLGGGLDLGDDGLVTALSMPRFRSIGFMPAATDFRPSRTMAWARTVAVVVPSPALSLVLEATSRISWAPMFSKRVFQLDFLGDRDAVLGRARGAEGLLDDHVAALGAQGDLHRVGEDVDAAQHAGRARRRRNGRLWRPCSAAPF